MYASTSNEVYRWPYNAVEGTIGNSETLVTNMSNTDVGFRQHFHNDHFPVDSLLCGRLSLRVMMGEAEEAHILTRL